MITIVTMIYNHILFKDFKPPYQAIIVAIFGDILISILLFRLYRMCATVGVL